MGNNETLKDSVSLKVHSHETLTLAQHNNPPWPSVSADNHNSRLQLSIHLINRTIPRQNLHLAPSRIQTPTALTVTVEVITNLAVSKLLGIQTGSTIAYPTAPLLNPIMRGKH